MNAESASAAPFTSHRSPPEQPDCDGTSKDRQVGLLVGLAAGDRNGGPVQMALALAESLCVEAGYDPVAAMRAYHRWW
eukprot:SAG31_NODE_27612_length_423_cov_0.793210_1_plen_77_part_10